MASQAQQAASSSRPLNPEMVYRPLTPPSPSNIRFEDDDDKPIKRNFHLIGLLRTFIVLFAIVGFFNLITARISSDLIAILLFVEMAVVLLWNLHKLSHRCGQRSGSRSALSCQAGGWKCYLGPSDAGDEGGNGDDGNDKPDSKRPRIAWLIDLGLSMSLLLLSLLGDFLWPFWIIFPRRLGLCMIWTIVVLEFAVSVLSHFRIAHPIVCHIYPQERGGFHGERSRRIRLPGDSETGPARGKNLSVSA